MLFAIMLIFVLLFSSTHFLGLSVDLQNAEAAKTGKIPVQHHAVHKHIVLPPHAKKKH